MKNDIRKNILKIRKALDSEQVKAMSALICENLVKSEMLVNANNIMIYLDFNNEVSTEPILDMALSRSKRVFVPVCMTKTKELVVSEILNATDLCSGAYGIREPQKSSLRITDREILDLIIIPAAAFDRDGNRIGYGAGYYDKFLNSISISKNICKIGLAYSFQIAQHIPTESHDIPMDYIITENEIIKCKA